MFRSLVFNHRLFSSLKKPEVEKPAKLPRLINLYKRKRQPFIPAVPSVIKAPFGKQQQVVLDVLADQGKNEKFVYPLQKLVFNYCDFGGSSKGMRKDLVEFAKQNPQFEIIVQPKPYHHPLVRGYYYNDFYKYQCVRNQSPAEIMKTVRLFMNSNAMAPIQPKYSIFTRQESMKGIWSPFKDPKLRPESKPQAPKFLYSNQ